VTKAIVRARPLLTHALAWAAIVVGVVARVFTLAVRPLWADEIFTLTVARKSASEILAALRVDSGPPLHYCVAHVLLAPFPTPGLPDVLVRVLSLIASLLHIPLFFAVARRLGRPEMGLPAAALYSVFPLAVVYAAEGRAYALASLLALLAFERALALRERPRLSTALGLTLAAAGAVLTHYLAVFPVAALAILALDARPAARHALVLSGLAATALAATWVPIALAQPRASMAWSRDTGFASAVRDFPANLAFGAPAGGPAMAALGVAGAVLLAALLIRDRRGVLAPVARVLGLSLALLALAQLGASTLVLPDRTALVFLPFAVLLLAAAPPFVPAAAGTLATALLALWLPRAAEPSTGALLARLLDAPARAGRRVLAAGYWGPELEYRLARVGAPGRVVLFPSAVAAHPGWYREEELRDATLAAEADAILSTPQAPTLFVLPRGSRASAAIASRLGRTRRLLSSPLVDVVETRSP
jgi:uncharacterized membrane protein